MRFDDLMRDARYAIRSLARTPGFSIIAVFTLALGIAANTAVFSVADTLLLQPLPYPDADRLVALRSTNGTGDVPGSGMSSALDLADWQAQATSFEAIAGYRWRTVDLTGGGSSERLRGLYVTPEYFDVFGLTRVDGRTFRASDRGTDAIVLGREVWAERFASNRALLGSILDVNMINLSRAGATPNVVLGAVLTDAHFPPLTADFNLGEGTEDDTVEFWLPEFPPAGRRDARGFDVVAKLKPGVTAERAQAEMTAIATHLAETFPETNRGWRVRVVPLRAQMAGAPARIVLLLTLGTGLVLLIACANVSTLLLVRGVSREHEVAVRSALGASRARLVEQFLVESLFISTAAAILGAAGASIGIHFLVPWFPSRIPLIRHAAINGTALAFVTALTILATCLTGLAPAWVSSAHRFTGFRARAQTASRWQRAAIDLLTLAQVAFTIVLLISTGLLLRSADRLWHVDPGFDPAHVLTMTISLPNNKFDWQHNVTFERDVTAAVKALPSVRGAAAIQGVPMRAGGFWTSFRAEGMPPRPAADLPVAHLRVISAGYFGVLQIPLVDGRDFDARDDVGERGRPKFVIVNQTLAARYWPGQTAVGRRLEEGFNLGEWVTVAGVAADVHYGGLDAPPELEIYLPDGIFPEAAMTLLVKTTADPLLAVADVRSRIAQVDRDAFVSDVRTMDGLIGDSMASRLFATLLLVICASVALTLALGGIYGIVSQAAAQRRMEIGIRIAIGATPVRIVALMLQRSTLPVLAGAAIGLVAAAAAAQVLSAMLYSVKPFDPLTFAAAAAMFAVVALVSALIPAVRATRVDPITALRCE